MAAAQRSYEGVSQKEFFEAATQVFQLHDPIDVAFDYRSERMLVSRWFTAYFVFGSLFGKTFWELETEQDGSALRVDAAAITEVNGGLISFPITKPFEEDIDISGVRNIGATVDDYNLLFDRIDYFLGRQSRWTTCQDVAENRVEPGSEMTLCDMIGIRDLRPERASEEPL